MNNLSKFFLALLVLCPTLILEARQPYHAAITVGPETATISDPNLVDLTRALKTDNIRELIVFYTPVTPVEIDINLRGIDIETSFAAFSTTLEVAIPVAGIFETFTGETRDDSIKLFKEFIKEGSKNRQLLRAYAKYSPIDPIAGNPNSAMAVMAQSDYLLGRLSPLSGCDPCCWQAQPITHQFQSGLEWERGFSEGFDTTSVTLPLRYSYSPNRRWALIVDAPFTFNANGGAYSVFASMGIGVRFPITTFWSLTPILRIGGGGSFDLCTSGNFFTTGLTSNLDYKVGSYVLSMTNSAIYSTTTNLWLTGINFNYHLQGYIFKNGLSFTSCEWLKLCGRPVNYSVTFIDSYFTSNRLYMRHYDEVGFAFIVNDVNPCLDYDCLSLGISYLFGQKHYHGYSLNIVYQF